jgi:hypothetical protein
VEIAELDQWRAALFRRLLAGLEGYLHECGALRVEACGVETGVLALDGELGE